MKPHLKLHLDGHISVLRSADSRAPTFEQIATARANLFANGVTVQDFCQKHGLSYNAVMAVLHGRSRAIRGEGHKAAVLLGLKPTPTKKRMEELEQKIFGIPDRLRELIAKSGLSQAKFAALIDVDIFQLKNVLSGQMRPPTDLVKKVLERCDVDAMWFVTGQSKAPPPVSQPTA